ncbi:MAG: DNA mismatch repair endonuclease MutL [Bdellovibrionales bacterium]|nr:DNA mismatch repair endonuclease MutL [Bdellovibrionales bacterium]
MKSIQLLSEDTINRIAAGEVVERPLSVVRELIDNSLDAGATNLTVEIENGGQSFIRIVDDGSGIHPEEIELAFERHATSKLTSEEDLSNLDSYGFRGEALAAIASVSKVRIRSRHASQKSGVELELEGGSITSRKLAACQVGTEILVQDLFFNTPARRKFLKTERGEVGKISSWLKSNLLLHPEVRLIFKSDGKEKVRLAKRESCLERAREIFGPEVVEVDYDEPGGLRVTGLLGAPHLAKVSPTALSLFVNRRLLVDRSIVRAIREGYGGTVKPQQTPLGFLHVELPASLVDVNVHPQKQEVRFWDSSKVFQLVLRSVRIAVGSFQVRLGAGAELRPQREISSGSPIEAGRFEFTGSRRGFDASLHSFTTAGSFVSSVESDPLSTTRSGISFAGSMAVSAGVGPVDNVQETPQSDFGGTPFRYQDLRYVGTVLQCYLLCEWGEQFVVIDMHAAHERINYNQILQKLRRGDLKREKLLIPLSVQCDEEAVERILDHRLLLERCGFRVEKLTPEILEISEKPTWIPLKHVKAALTALGDDDLPVERALEAELEKVAARLACHASIRSGDIQSREEVYALFAALDETEWNSACPHGRPVVIHFTKAELERRFGRVG